MKTKAAVVYEHNQPVVVEELTLDEPKANEVLLKMVAAGVCHSDLSVIRDVIHYVPPVALGHEGAGIVESVGEGVTYVQPGDHVILSYVSFCGECVMCQKGKAALCIAFSTRMGHLIDDTCRLHNADGQDIPQMARVGTMSEYAVVPIQNVIKIDPNYPLEKAVLIGCGVPTGVGAVLNTAQIEPGSSVAVIGTGGVGLNAIQGAVIAGAKQIIAVDIDDRKLEMATSFGATDAVNATEGDPVAQVKALTDGLGVDYAFEVIGNPKTIKQAYDMVCLAGMAVVVGMSHHESEVSIPAQPLVRSEKRLVGSFYGSCAPREEMPKLLNFYDEGKLKLDELISQNYRLDQVNEAFDDLKSGKNARGVILF